MSIFRQLFGVLILSSIEIICTLCIFEISGMKNDMSGFLSDERSKQLSDVWKQINLLPETFQALSTSAVATGKCQQEEKHIRNFEVNNLGFHFFINFIQSGSIEISLKVSLKI